MALALFTLQRTLHDIRRDGRSAIVRKSRHLLPKLARSRPVVIISLFGKLGRFWIQVLMLKESKHRSLAEERIDVLRRRTRSLNRSERERTALRLKYLLRTGRLSDADDCLSQCGDDVASSPEVVDQRAQLEYLRGNWSGSVALRRQVLEEVDRRGGESWLSEVGVRFVSGAFIGHIGHLGLIDLIQRARFLEELSPEPRVFVGPRESVANVAYLECWRPHMDLHYLDLVEYRSFEELMRPLFDDVTIVRLKNSRPDFYRAYAMVNAKWRDESRSALISPDPEMIERARSVFEHHGLERGQWFVGLHVREGDPFPWSNAVDSDMSTYLPAIRTIRAAGGAVIRIGSPNMWRLPEMSGVIDYAVADWKSPELDVFVWSQCRFFIGTGSGPSNIPPTFGRPTLLTNFPCVALDQGFNEHAVLPKRLVRRDGSGVPYAEVLSGPFGFGISRTHQGYDWHLEDNTPEELEGAVHEMIDLTSVACGFEQVIRAQQSALDELHALGRTGWTPFPQSFVDRHPSLFGL